MSDSGIPMQDDKPIQQLGEMAKEIDTLRALRDKQGDRIAYLENHIRETYEKTIHPPEKVVNTKPRY